MLSRTHKILGFSNSSRTVNYNDMNPSGARCHRRLTQNRPTDVMDDSIIQTTNINMGFVDNGICTVSARKQARGTQ